MGSVLLQQRARWRRLSLATRLTLWYVGLLALLLLVFVLLVQAALSRWLYSSTMTQLRAQAASVQRAMETDAGADRTLATVAARAVDGVPMPDVWVVVVTREGGVAARSGGSRRPVSEVPIEGLRALASGRSEWWGTFTGLYGRIAAVLIPLPDTIPHTAAPSQDSSVEPTPEPVRIVGPQSPGGRLGRNAGPGFPALSPLPPLPPLPALEPLPPVPALRGPTSREVNQFPELTRGFVQVSTPLGRAEETLLAARWLLAGASILVLALALAIGPQLTRLGLRPVRAIARTSAMLAGGDLSVRVPPTQAEDEVGELTRAFNHMGECLEAAFTAQEASIAAQRAFVADASHELRSPLTALGGQLEMLQRSVQEDPAEVVRLTTFMRREVTRMSRLVEDLLTLARLDAQGAQALRRQKVHLHAVAQDVYEQARALPAAQGKEIRLENGKPAVLDGDPVRLHQVLLNLMVNAVEHTPTGGTVSMVIERQDGEARVRVRDTGPGIPPEHLPYIFDRFYRADASRVRNRGGAGLGLAISQAIVTAHGGTIAATSAPDSGAVFSVSLPCCTDSVPSAR